MCSFYSPLAVSAPFYGYLKLLKLHRTERSRNKDVRSGNRTQDLLHEGRALTDCAILAPESVESVDLNLTFSHSNPSGCGAGLWSHIWIVFRGRASGRQHSSFGPTSLSCALCNSVYGLQERVISKSLSMTKEVTRIEK